MADRISLRAERRTTLGKKVKRLRKEGLLPANVYGRGLESNAIQLDARDFRRAIRSAGVRSMFELAIDGESSPRHVLVRGLSRAGGMGDPIHVDFYQVDLDRPIQTTVALRFVGEAPAVRDLAGTLLPGIEFVTVRCLPLAIPDAIEVDVSAIETFDVTLTVGDLAASEGVEILTASDIAVATVNPPRLRLEGEEEEEGFEEEGEAAEAGEAPAADSDAEGSGDGGD